MKEGEERYKKEVGNSGMESEHPLSARIVEVTRVFEEVGRNLIINIQSDESGYQGHTKEEASILDILDE
ncbi:hypothetical protein Tco_0710013 [Tanacetum coccineum]